MSFFSFKERAFGLDISDRDLRLIQLKSLGPKVRVQLYNEIRLPAGCVVGGRIKQAQLFIDLLNKLIKTVHGHGRLSDKVVACLPETETFLKTLSIPLSSAALARKKILQILPEHLPYDSQEIYFDWQVVSKNETTQTILVGAAPQDIANSYLEVLSQANLMPLVLEIEAAAISRILCDFNNDPEPKIIIDFGANRCGLILYDQGTIQFTISLPVSGNQINERISGSLDLSSDQADAAKISCGLDKKKCQGAVYEILTQAMDELSSQILKALDYYRQNFSSTNDIRKMILTGGGSNIIGIEKMFSDKLKIPIMIADPFKKITCQKNYFNSARSRSYVTAAGLALRGLNLEI